MMSYHWRDYQIHWDKALVSSALLECESVYRTELSELTYDLNQYHGVSWSSAQYEKLIGYWLRTFIHQLFDRWHGSRAGKPIQLQGESRPNVDLVDHSSYYTSDLLNESLYWQLATLGDKGRLGQLSLPDRLSFSKSFQVIGNGSDQIQVHSPYHSYGIPKWRRHLPFNSFPGKLRSLASPITIRAAPAISSQVDSVWRLSRSKQVVSSFAEVCGVLVRLHCPAIAVEGFNSMRNAASQHPARFLYTAGVYSTPLMYLAAEWHEKARLLVHQHGGGYGIDKRSPNEDHERAISDCFFTWGWSEGTGTKALPVPPRIRGRRPKLRSGILLRCGNHPRYAYKIQYHEMAGNNQTLIDRTIRFAGALARHGLEISYYAHDYGWNVQKQFAAANVSIAKRSKGAGHYALHTFNYLGSAWLETLAADIPTVCFYDPAICEFRETAVPFIEKLRHVGILHESPDSASDMVLEILSDPLKWWQSAEVQDARLAFVKQYARLDDDWLDAWIEEFTQIANLG